MSGRRARLLETDRLRLRPLAIGDERALAGIYGDDRVTRYLPFVSWQTAEDAVEWRSRMLSLVDSGAALLWVLVERATDTVIGTLVLFHFVDGLEQAEVGYVLGKDHWGRGLMGEALDSLCAEAFGALGLERLLAQVDPRNTASIRLLERLGFGHPVLLGENTLIKGEVCDTLRMVRLAPGVAGEPDGL